METLFFQVVRRADEEPTRHADCYIIYITIMLRNCARRFHSPSFSPHRPVNGVKFM